MRFARVWHGVAWLAVLGVSTAYAEVNHLAGDQVISPSDLNFGTAQTGPRADRPAELVTGPATIDTGVVSCECYGPTWRFAADILRLDRSEAARLPLVTGGGFLFSDNLTFAEDTGARFSLFREGDCDAWEFGYMGLEWNSAATVVGANDLSAVAGSVDYVTADTVGVTYFSELDGFAINRHYYRNGSFSMMAGFRIFTLDEAFNMQTTDVANTSNYQILTDNDLYGFQLGANYQKDITCRLSIYSKWNAGIYWVNSAQAVSFGDNNNTASTTYANNRDSVAFVGEIDAGAAYRWNDRLTFRSGLEMLWLEGVALAPEQFQNTTAAIATAPPVTHGGVFAYGLYVGGEFAY